MKLNLNLIVVIGADGRYLMCRRRKNPYKGLYNFVGGHIEPNESGEDAAYRELEEETGITRDEITLKHMVDFTYYYDSTLLETWAGASTTRSSLAARRTSWCGSSRTPTSAIFHSSRATATSCTS